MGQCSANSGDADVGMGQSPSLSNGPWLCGLQKDEKAILLGHGIDTGMYMHVEGAEARCRDFFLNFQTTGQVRNRKVPQDSRSTICYHPLDARQQTGQGRGRLRMTIVFSFPRSVPSGMQIGEGGGLRMNEGHHGLFLFRSGRGLGVWGDVLVCTASVVAFAGIGTSSVAIEWRR